MSGQHPPLTCDQFKAILSKLDFQKREKKSGASHEDWVATIDGTFRKVTVDCPKAPFSQDLSINGEAGRRHEEDDIRNPLWARLRQIDG